MSTIVGNSAMLAPVIALVLWSLVMWVWMYATRIPAMQKAGGEPDNTLSPTELAASIPAPTRWPADNYNHLMEQPTIFYAAALAAAMAGLGDGMALYSAWAYVGLRVVHSILQSTVNHIMARFAIFSLSTVALAILTIMTAMEVM
ncbi:MAG: MAPEG family protein [Alphaproteobacteria bacterium]